MKKILVMFMTLCVTLGAMTAFAPAASAASFDDAWNDVMSNDPLRQARGFEAAYSGLWRSGQRGAWSEVQRAATLLATGTTPTKRACLQVNAASTLTQLRKEAQLQKSVKASMDAMYSIAGRILKKDPRGKVLEWQQAAANAVAKAAISVKNYDVTRNGYLGAYAPVTGTKGIKSVINCLDRY